MTYDPYGGRFIHAILTEGNSANSAILVAASTSSEPAVFNQYRFSVDDTGNCWGDYLTLGFNKDWIVVTTKLLPVSGHTCGGGLRVYAIEKANVYSGAGTGAFTWTHTNLCGGGCDFPLMPVATFSETLDIMYFVGTYNRDLGQVRVHAITGPISNPVMGGGAIVTGTAWSNPAAARPPLGSTSNLEVLGDVIMNAMYRDGYIWAAQTVGLPAGGATRTAAQWWQIDPASTAPVQFGRVDDATGEFDYFFPTIATNNQGDALLGYSRSSATTFAGGYYSWRQAGDAANTMRATTTLKAGERDYPGNRWGDYSATVVDPVNDRDMWTIQEYAWDNSGNCCWAMWWGQVTFAPNQAPAMQAASCAPNPSSVTQSVTCTVRATDDSSGVFYEIDWGDGSPTTRVPSSGTVAPGNDVTAQHAWSSAGTFTVTVTATDNGSPALTSTPRTHSQTVQATNGEPVMQSLSCSPNPSVSDESVSCSFMATDDSTGVAYTVDWGDGSPTTRVPASGFAGPGTTASANHAWSSPGTFTVSVTATDNAEPPRSSAPRTTSQTVTAGNQRPVMQSLSCSPNPSDVDESVSCSVRATDDSSGLFYQIDWGDGSGATRIPATGTVAPGTTQSAAHAWSAPGTFTVSATATDNAAEPLTSTAMNVGQSVEQVNTKPVMDTLSCSPNPSTVGGVVTCHVRASDDSDGVYYQVTWGDGSPATRIPSTGTVAPGTLQSATHSWPGAGSYTVSATATDSESPPLVSTPLSLTQTVETGTCVLSRSGSLVLGLAGIRIEGISSRTEVGIPAPCRGRAYTLEGSSVVDDFDVCWVAGSTELACDGGPDPQTGFIPTAADTAVIVYMRGVNGSYTLRAA